MRGVSERWVMQQVFEASCAVLSVPAFEVTPAQVMALKNFRLSGYAYFDIGSGLLPFSITPADATSSQARAMFVADWIRDDAFNLGADPESGAIGPSEVAHLRNLSGYTPQGWTEAHTQLWSTRGMLWDLMGNAHPVVLAYGRFLRLYERLETRLESELDYAYARCLGPSLMVFHVQLAILNWLDCQLTSVRACTFWKCRTTWCGCQPPPMFLLCWPCALPLKHQYLVELHPVELAQEQAIVDLEKPPPLPLEETQQRSQMRSWRSSSKSQQGCTFCWQHPFGSFGTESFGGTSYHGGWVGPSGGVSQWIKWPALCFMARSWSMF
jgi:hypothetical protein